MIKLIIKNLVTLFVLTAGLPAHATLNDVDKTQIWNKNLLVNGGFENGKAKWTASGGTFAVTTSSPMIGKVHATWDSSSASQTLTSTAVAIPAGMLGRNGAASCLITVASGTATHTLEAYDGTNILASSAITSNTSPVRTSVNFIFPSSGSISVRLVSVAADEPSIAIDDCYVGPAEGYNISSVSQATFVGGMENAGANSCVYSQNSSTGLSDFVDFGTGTSCAAWTVVSNGPGTISAQGTNDHRLVYTNMPPGNYRFELSGMFFNGNNVAGIQKFRLSDGTNSYQAQGYQTQGAGIAVGVPLLVFHVTVTTAGNRTYKIQASDDGVVTPSWANSANNPASWKVYRYPLSSEQAYTPDLTAQSWSGYHDSTCGGWTRTNTAFGDFANEASCALVENNNNNFGSVTSATGILPGITFTPKKAGRYYACAVTTIDNSGAGNITSLRLTDGTVNVDASYQPGANNYDVPATLCGIFVATSTAAMTIKLQGKAAAGTIAIIAVDKAVNWSIFAIDQAVPAPNILNQVVSANSGGDRICRFRFAGGSRTTDCSASPCTVYAASGSCVTSVTRSGTGDYDITFAAGTFSDIPQCVANSGEAVLGGPLFLIVKPSSTTAAELLSTGTASATDSYGDVICIGAK